MAADRHDWVTFVIRVRRWDSQATQRTRILGMDSCRAPGDRDTLNWALSASVDMRVGAGTGGFAWRTDRHRGDKVLELEACG